MDRWLKLDPDDEHLVGEWVRITLESGRSFEGEVKSAHHYGEDHGWYIEIYEEPEDVRTYRYWKQCDEPGAVHLLETINEADVLGAHQQTGEPLTEEEVLTIVEAGYSHYDHFRLVSPGRFRYDHPA